MLNDKIDPEELQTFLMDNQIKEGEVHDKAVEEATTKLYPDNYKEDKNKRHKWKHKKEIAV